MIAGGQIRENQKYYRRASSKDDGEMTKPFSKKEIEQAKLQLRRQPADRNSAGPTET